MALGESVSVEVEVAVPGVGVKVALLHDAVTVLGRPEIESVIGPLNEPPVLNVNRSVTLVPCATGVCVVAGENPSVGAVRETLRGRPPLAE